MGKHSSERSRSRSKSTLSSHRNSDASKGLKRKHSSPSRDEKQAKQSPNRKHAKEASRKHKKHSKKSRKNKRRDSSSDSSSSDSSTSSSSSEERERRRKERKRRKKEKKLVKKQKKEKKQLERLSESIITGPPIALKSEKEMLEGPDKLLSERAKAMAPMTKEEWDKRQSVVRRVYDEETGRHRMIKGDGEIIEEIVSRDRHMAINRQSTKGDGDYFQAVANKMKK